MNKLFFLAAIFMFLTLKTPAWAVDLTVKCDDSPVCTTTPSGNAALFYEENMLPGYSVRRSITVQNNRTADSCDLYLETKNEADNDNLASVLFSVIYDADSDIYGITNGPYKASSSKTLNNLFSESSIFITAIPALSNKNIYWTVTFDPDAGNQYKYKETVFDFDLIFSCGIPPSPTPTITSTPVPTSTPIPGPTETPGPGPTSTPGPSSNTVNPTATVVPPVFYPLSTPLVTVEPTGTEAVLGGEITPSPTSPGGVLGSSQITGSAVCHNPWWWFLLLAFQMTLNLSVIRRIPKKWASFTNFIIFAVNTVSVLIFWKYFCTKNYLLLSFMFGMLSFYLHLRRVRRKRFQKVYSSYIYPEIRLPGAAI